MWQYLEQLIAGAAITWVRALSLKPEVTSLLGHSHAVEICVLQAVLATISIMAGQAVVLVINRLRRGALLLSLSMSVALLIIGYIVEGFIVWAVARIFFIPTITALQASLAVMLSAAPLVFSFLSVIPILGPLIERFLQAWSFLVLWVCVAEMFDLGGIEAAAMTLTAWSLMVVLNMALNRPLARLRDRLYRRITGRPLRPSASFLLAQAAIPCDATRQMIVEEPQ